MSVRCALLALVMLLLTACGSPTPAVTSTAPPAAEADPYGGANSAPAPTVAPTVAPTTPTDAPAAPAATATSAPAANPATDALVTFTIVPAESNVMYEVGETFFNQNNRFVVAVGTTQTLEGTVQVDRSNPQNSTVGPITVDISAFQSDSPRRDQAIRDRWLESARFPLAVFTPTTITGLPSTRYTDGETLTLTITGDLAIREVSQPTTFTVVGQINGDEMTGEATTTILMSDFGFSPPNIAGILGAEDEVKLTFRFVARP